MRETGLWRRRIGMGVLVALIGLLGLADFLSHTDDGCAVEVHCLACRAQLTPASPTSAPDLVFAGANHVLAVIRVEDQRPHDDPSRLLPRGRAPPVSA